MRIISIAIVALLLVASVVLAQQDPNDPGLPDSIIVVGTSVDSGVVMATARVFIVTDDSICYFNLPIAWNAPRGGVYPASQLSYFPGFPPNRWDFYDSVITSQNYFRIWGMCDGENPVVLNTNEARVNIFNLRFMIAGAPSQVINIFAGYDSINGSIEFGLIDGMTAFQPAFLPGQIVIQAESATSDERILPQEFSLYQNYPNPFNAQTLIQYNLPGESDVSLTIFDILGRQVETLIDGYQTAGPHQVIWDAENAPSGIYFYMIKADNNIETKRMLLLR